MQATPSLPARNGGSVDARPVGPAAIVARAAKRALADDVPMLASALAYSAFFAIPATLLLVVGVFSLIADPALVDRLMNSERCGMTAPKRKAPAGAR